jgi:hypothetical protein
VIVESPCAACACDASVFGGAQIADSSAALTAALDPRRAEALRLDDCVAANTSRAAVLTSAITTATTIERADCGFVDLLMGMRPD